MTIIDEANNTIAVEDEKVENPGLPSGEVGRKMLHRMNDAHGYVRDFGLPLINWKPGMRILDAGCGGGATIRQMLDLSEGSQIDGIDYAELSVQESKELNSDELGKRVHVQQANVLALPFADGTFDLVTGVETVYFWPDIEKAFAEVRRVLKPGGVFAILNEGSDPENNDWEIPENVSMRIYYPEELTALLEKAGFSSASFARNEEQVQLICVQGVK